MNKRAILKELRKMDSMGISRNEYFLTFGSAMVMLGLREETSDIDITGSSHAINMLKDQGLHLENYPKREGVKYIKVSKYIDVFEAKSLSTKPQLTTVDGYQLQSAESILAEKKSRNREKDQADIAALEKYLKTKKKGTP